MASDEESLHAVIARVRRAMPRNADVMRICEFAEEAMRKPAQSTPAPPKEVAAGRRKR